MSRQAKSNSRHQVFHVTPTLRTTLRIRPTSGRKQCTKLNTTDPPHLAILADLKSPVFCFRPAWATGMPLFTMGANEISSILRALCTPSFTVDGDRSPALGVRPVPATHALGGSPRPLPSAGGW